MEYQRCNSTADKEITMSKWIVTPREPQPFDYIDFPDADRTYNIKCSECGKEFSSETSTISYKFCPYCCTKMEHIGEQQC